MPGLTYNQLQFDPDFQNLTYKQQTMVRMQVLEAELQNDPDFQGLNQDQKVQALMELVYAAPALKDKRAEQLVNEIGTRAQAGDRRATVMIQNAVALESAKHNAILLGLFGRAFEPYVKEVSKKMLAQGVDWSESPFVEIGDPSSVVEDKERDKILDYYALLGQRDAKLGRAIQYSKSLPQLLGIAADAVTMYGLLAGTYAAPVGLGKLAMKPFQTMMSKAITPGQRVLAHIGGEVAHGLATSSLWVARENVLKLVNDELPKNPTFKEMVVSNSKYFAQAFLWDVVANLAVGVVWPMVKSLGRNFRGWGNIDVFLRQFDEEQYRRILMDAIVGNEIEPRVFQQLPEVVQRRIKAGQAFHRVFSHVPRKNADDLFQAMAMANGWTASPVAGTAKWRMEFNGGGIDKTFGSRASADKFLNDWLETIKKQAPEGVIKKTARDSLLSGAAYDQVRIRKIVQTQLRAGSEQNVDVLARLAAPKGSRWTPGQIKGFAKASVRAAGAGDDVVRRVVIEEAGGEIIAKLDDTELGRFPKEIRKVQQETDALKNFFENVKKYTGDEFTTADDLLKEYKSELARQKLFTPTWVKHAVEDSLGARLIEKPAVRGHKALYQVIKGDEVISFRSLDDVGNWAIAKTMDQDFLAHYLRKYEGLRLYTRADENVLELKRGNQVIATAENVEELLTQFPELAPKISTELGPQLAFVDNHRVSVKYVRGAAVGPYELMMKELDRFKNYRPEEMYVEMAAGRKGSLRVHKLTKQAEIYLPDLEYRSPVSSITKARKLLARGFTEWDDLTQVAAAKGYRIDPYNGNFIVYSAGEGSSFLARNQQELEATLRQVPIPDWAPELTGIEAMGLKLEHLPKPPENMFKPMEFSITPLKDTMPAKLMLEAFYRPPDAWLVRAVEHGNDPTILKFFRQIEDTRAFLRGEEYKTGQAIYSAFVHKGKMMKRGRRVVIGEYLKAKGDDAKRAVQEVRQMTDDELLSAQRLRELFGTDPEKGLFQKFGVRTEDFLEDYLPRIRKFYNANSWKAYQDGKGERLRMLRDAFDGATPPGSLDAFFKHQRTSDVLRIALEDDPLALMLKYSTVGHRNRFLDPLWRQVDQYLRKNTKSIDGKLLKRFRLYQAQIMGIPQGMAEKWVRDASRKAFEALGVRGKLGDDVTRLMMSWGYLAAMGFRPWMPIRNTFQIWTTLGPRVGNDWVAHALRKIANDKKGILFEPLRRKGLMTTHLPLYGAEVFDNTTLLGKITHKGLQWYKNSDDFTRAVAYYAAHDRFMDAAERFAKMGPEGMEKGLFGGTMTKQNFMRMSGIDLMADDVKNRILGLIDQGHWNAAADMFGVHITTETMFPYRSGMGPTAFKGLIGKLFGMMGHYPVYYIENIKRGLKYGSTAAKIGYATTFLANSTALYYIFKEGLGINANNFIWWVPGNFTGGPYYGLMNQALEAMDFRSYKGRQARAELLTEMPRWMLGFQWNSIVKAYESFQKGDSLEGIYNLTSVPINPEWFGQDPYPSPGILIPHAIPDTVGKVLGLQES